MTYGSVKTCPLAQASAHASTQFSARSNVHSITSIFARHLRNIRLLYLFFNYMYLSFTHSVLNLCLVSCYCGGVSMSTCMICVVARLVIYLGVHSCYFTSFHVYTSLWIERCRREWDQYLPLSNQYIYDSRQLHGVRFLCLIIPNHYKFPAKGYEVKWYYWTRSLQIHLSYCRIYLSARSLLHYSVVLQWSSWPARNDKFRHFQIINTFGRYLYWWEFKTRR